MEDDFSWEDDLMAKSFQRQESHLARLAKTHGRDYGKPQAGSESEKRSQAYQKNVLDEVVNICGQIAQFGKRSPDGTEHITFGELFKLNEKVSNKCVGLLQRARRHRLLHFPGETLWQGEDDKIVVSLLRKNREIQKYFTDTRQLLPNNPDGNLWLDIESGRRAHFDWVTNVRGIDDLTTAYQVQVDQAEFDDDQELPQRSFPFTREEEKVTPVYLVEPQVIFRLIPGPRVSRPPLVVCPALDYFQPCLPGEAEDLAPLGPDLRAELVQHENKCTLLTTCIITKTKHCPKLDERTILEVEIRPLVRLYKRNPSPEARIRKPSLPSPKSSIKFSACTTLYQPAQPVYEEYKKLQPAINHDGPAKQKGSAFFQRFHQLARARSETPTDRPIVRGERNVRRVSLYR